MRTRFPNPILLALSMLIVCTTADGPIRTHAQVPAGASGGAAARSAPRLVVLLSVDQMRADYVDKYRGQWTGGLKRLIERGAWFRNAAYPYMNTATCPGHATISTGTLPATHGMVLNGWWDRATGQMVTCTEDGSVRDLGAHGTLDHGDSLGRLLVTTLSDELRAQRSPASHVVALSLKARSAITLAGHRADLVLWYGGADGWTTSTAYTKVRDVETDRFIAEHPIEADFKKIWDRTLPVGNYLFDDAGEGEGKEGWGATFPHVVGSGGKPNDKFYALWEASPFSDEYLGALAARAVERFDLGRPGRTDYLAISFSALDVVGHAFGPRSHEVQDLLVRLDGTIGRLLDALDRHIGPQNYVLALTADHGVAPIPEQMNAMGVDAGRIPIDMDDPSGLNARIAKHLGHGNHVAALVYTDLYLAPGVYDQLRAKPGALDDVIRYLEGTRGVERVLRRDDIIAGHLPPGELLARSVALGFNRDRSGDLLIIPRAYWIISTAATTHGTGYGYDARVPILLFGHGVRPGEYLQPASPADVAPTLAVIAGITLPRRDGRVLAEALASAREQSP